MTRFSNQLRRLSGLCLLFVVGFCLQCAAAMAETPAEREVWLSIAVINGLTEYPVSDARVAVLDSVGTMLADSLPSEVVSATRSAYDLVVYSCKVPLHDSYIVRVNAKGFSPYERVETPNVQRDVEGRYLGGFAPIELTPTEPAELTPEKPDARKLKEVTVTATKVKMVMRGDTIEYDATAFRLPRGSMLDDLIRELPGATLNDDGQIAINGRFVSELLVNGRNFFKGDPQVALRNLPHYTVKNIQVYHRAPDYMTDEQAAATEDKNDFKYVIDVNLKREYIGGWISNFELGAGSSLRKAEAKWLGRAFAMTFTKLYYVAMYANANNLNNSSKAGSKGEWSKPDPTAGDTRVIRGGVEYNTDWIDQSRNGVNLKIDAVRETSALTTGSISEMYLPGGNVYSQSRVSDMNKSTRLGLDGDISRVFGKVRPSMKLWLAYSHGTARSDYNRVQSDTYSDVASPDFARSLLYQREKITDSRNNTYHAGGYVSVKPWGGLLPEVFHIAHLNIRGAYRKSELRSHYSDRIGYPQDAGRDMFDLFKSESPSRNHYVDIKEMLQLRTPGNPRHRFEGGLNYTYSNEFDSGSRLLKYSSSDDGRDDGEDTTETAVGSTAPSMGGIAEWLTDERNSYRTVRREQSHDFRPSFGFYMKGFNVNVSADIKLLHRKLSDMRTGTTSHLIRNDVLCSTNLSIGNNDAANSRSLDLSVRQTAPSEMHLLDVRDSSDPLLIILGNSRLKKTTFYEAEAVMRRSMSSHQRMYSFSLSAVRRNDVVAVARYYDRTSGVTTTRPQNINGNWHANARLVYSRTLDRNDRLYVSNSLSPRFEHSVDYSSVTDIPVKVAVDGWSVRDNFAVRYSPIESLKLNAKVYVDWNRLKSLDGMFDTFAYLDVNYGIGVKYTLPGGIDLDTDLMAYCRRGYIDSALNGTDWVWNLQLSRSFGRQKEWTLKAIGFDILHQLPTVRHTVNAQGNTEVRYNSQPAYALLTLTYRLDIKPQKK